MGATCRVLSWALNDTGFWGCDLQDSTASVEAYRIYLLTCVICEVVISRLVALEQATVTVAGPGAGARE